ncbi:MAG: acetate/propionate family kinase [Cyanobacteriota bacterium]
MPTDLVLVLNAGSSSLKASLVDSGGHCLWRDQRPCAVAAGEQPEPVLQQWLPAAVAPWAERISLVGHRVVHGGERFVAPTRVDAALLEGLEQLLPLAPLHNGAALGGVRWCRQWRPDLPQWACFDTAFHSTIPPRAHTYALPQEWRRQGLRRFGFHGLNHQHVAEEMQRRFAAQGQEQEQGQGPGPLRLISCHLGAGCSLCAIEAGRSIATTMGFTPLDGLVMATRCGSLDPGLVLHLLRGGLEWQAIDHVLNHESGLLGLSGLSGDMRELRQAAGRGHAGARLALEVFRHQLLQGIGAMAASLGGVDVVALSGGIGEHDTALHRELEHGLAWLPCLELVVVPADEEGVIARSCLAAEADPLLNAAGWPSAPH